MNTVSLTRTKLSLKAQTLYILCAVVSAVVFPQILHFAGFALGINTALGEILLPMHLPILLVGLLGGPIVGAVSGAIAPAVSFALTGMPKIALLPFMMIELCIYGLCSGLLKKVKIPTIAKVFISQISGRLIRACAILISFYLMKNTTIAPQIIISSISTGFIGIVLQLSLIPLIMHLVEKKND